MKKVYPSLLIALPLLAVAAFGSANGGLSSVFATDGYGGQPDSCPSLSSLSITPSNANVNPGQGIDFNGRNFAHEQDIIVYLDGAQISRAHADGGGNFTTGSLAAPTTAGSHTFSFVGVTCSTPVNSTVTVGSNGNTPGSTTTPPTMPPSASGMTVSPSTTTVSPGAHLDFSGRNFAHEENVSVSLDGTLVQTTHADGGGNFTTGSITVPSTPGTYTYTFIGSSSHSPITSTVTIQ